MAVDPTGAISELLFFGSYRRVKGMDFSGRYSDAELETVS